MDFGDGKPAGRKKLWCALTILSNLGAPLRVVSDFNIICGPDEKKGGADFPGK